MQQNDRNLAPSDKKQGTYNKQKYQKMSNT